jgi:hypothetical protein
VLVEALSGAVKHGVMNPGTEENCRKRDGQSDEHKKEKIIWNATLACCNFFGSEVDDSGYLRDLIDDATQLLNVDPKRIYADPRYHRRDRSL